MLNNLLLIACVCIVVALVFFFFYWNRFIAFLIGQIIRILWWNQETSSIWVEIGSIHFSLLAGRILLKDVCYHSSNQTIKIVKTQAQWRYWIRRPTSEEEIHAARGEDVKNANRLWLCRVQFSFQGVEWFLYNRTAAYDNIISQMEKSVNPSSRPSSSRRIFSRLSRQATPSPFYSPSVVKSSLRLPNCMSEALIWLRSQLPSLDPKDLLPLGIDVQTGAIILGNPSTPSLLVAEFHNVFGTFGIVPSRSRYDLYKQILSLNFRNAMVRHVPNNDYIDPMATIGSLVHSRIKQHDSLRKPSYYQTHSTFIKLWRQLKLFGLTMEYFSDRRSHRLNNLPTASSGKPPKLSDEETPVGIDFSTFEYAVERKILEAPALELTYYVDVVGEVPVQPSGACFAGDGIGNGDTPPEWGFDVVISGGFVRYGPWADRQRIELQRIFFPPTYNDIEIQPRLRPGDKRVWAALQVFVELRDETTLHIPFREASKDWQWDGLAHILGRPKKREYAAIDFIVGDRSSINYIMSMVPGPSGYESTLEVHLDTVTATSTLNDIRLLAAESCRIRCEMPSPLRWHTERMWDISVFLRQPTLFLLRDHINLFTDLGRDWVSGPPSDYQNFIPMIYSFKLEMHHFELNLYANDHNIIDKPLIKEENTLLILQGPRLKICCTIPSNVFRPETTAISFTVTSEDLVVRFLLPRWNTHAVHAPKEGITIFNTKLLVADGSYRYFAEVKEEHIEQLKLQLDVQGAVFKAFGWAIRYFMVLKDNYLGSFTHFQTLSEYLGKRKRDEPIGDPITLKYRPGKSNMLQVEISLLTRNTTTLLPTTLLGSGVSGANLPVSERISPSKAQDCLLLTVPETQLQFRMHDYFMEMSLNLDIITGKLASESFATTASTQAARTTWHEIFAIDGLDIIAKRLFGPQPKTSTYICIWEVAVGQVKSRASALELQGLVLAGNAFRLNFVDSANAPAEDFSPPTDLDVTFYKVVIESIDLTWKAGNAALSLQLKQGVKVDTNDLGTPHYLKVASLRVPHLSIKVLVTASGPRSPWLEAAELVCDGHFDIYTSPKGYLTKIRAQSIFIEEQDKFTGRAKAIFAQLRDHTEAGNPSERLCHKTYVYLPQPILPNITNDRATVLSHSAGLAPQIRPSSWRVSTFANLSESDDEGVSEADRDARLARTRTSTPIPNVQDEDDMTMSSGDESDDADLTDGNSTGDDWFDEENTSNTQRKGSLLSFYSPLTHHYEMTSACPPWEHHGPLFSRTREGALFKPPFHSPGDDSDVEDHPPFHLRTATAQSEDLRTLRVLCRKGVQIIVSPLLALAATSFEEDIKHVTHSPSMCIDSMMASCIGELSSQSGFGSLIFDLSSSQASLRILHHVTMSDEGQHQHIVRESTPSHLDVIAVIDVSLNKVNIASITSNGSRVFKSSVVQARAALDMSSDKRTLRSVISPSATLEVVASDIQTHTSPAHVTVNLGESVSKIGHSGPELATATCVSLLDATAQATRLHRGFKDYDFSAKRAIIYRLLQSSQNQEVIDPLSTIQPSYLVQSGIPRRLRIDTSFKFLYHLRTCIWRTNEFKNDYFYPSGKVDTIDTGTLITLVESRLALLEQDTLLASDLSYLPNIFAHDGQPAPQRPYLDEKSTRAITVKIPRSNIVVLAPAKGTSSELFLQDVKLSFHSKLNDLTQFTFNNPSSTSQTSLRGKSSRNVVRSLVTISADEISLVVLPHLMHFAQHILRVHRQLVVGRGHPDSATIAHDAVEKPSSHNSDLSHLELMVAVNRLRIQAAAENLVFVIGIKAFQTLSAVLVSHIEGPPSTNHSILFDEVYLQARSPVDSQKASDQDILAALTFLTGRISVIHPPDPGSRIKFKLIVILTALRFHVPRSALKLYRFIEEWRADYLPGIEATLNTLLSEYRAGPVKPTSPSPSQQAQRSPVFQIHGQVNHFEISLQVMHNTWLSLEINKTLAYNDPLPNKALPGATYNFGLQIASIILSISSKPNTRDVGSNSRVKLLLPPLTLVGNSDGYRVKTTILFEFIELKVKPSHWDTLLAVQQKFGQDFNDLVALMQKTRQKDVVPSSQPKGRTFEYIGFVKMRGFRVSLEGRASIVYLECQDINGAISNQNGWGGDLGLSDLALSLAPRVNGRQPFGFNRNHRTAFVIIDFGIKASKQGPSEEQHIQLAVTKIHAVMQPSSIGEFGDFIDNLQAEMLERQEQRAKDLAAFKEKTRSILKTFDVNLGETQTEKPPWIHRFIIKIKIWSIGVAFPLTHDEDLELPRPQNKDGMAVRAFLLSIKSIEFGTLHGETGEAIMEQLSLQFISRFRQSSPDDFAAENHQTRNRLVYPEMKAQLRSSSSGNLRKVWIAARVSGFIVDFDSSIPSYVFALVDVYRQGKERVERLSNIVPRTPLTAMPFPDDTKPVSEKHYSTIPTSHVFANLTFLSGKVRLYSVAASNRLQGQGLPFNTSQELSDEQILSLGAEVFNLPVVSVWAEYRATSALQKVAKNGDQEPSVLMFKSTVHSSQNTLRPALLPFITELVHQVETRMRKISSRFFDPPTVVWPPSSTTSLLKEDIPDSVTSMQICFSLRIDQSKLELTCQPDVNVIAGLHWESGGFVLNVSPGAKEVSFSGSIGGLVVGLKHGFLSEDCVKLDARNLAFSVSFANLGSTLGNSSSTITVILDTEFLGAVRFSRLQDILCFKAVWLDRIPIFNNLSLVDTKTPSRPACNDSSSEGELNKSIPTVVIMRIRQIQLEVDLGQSITSINLDLSQLILRTRLAEESNEVSLSVGDVRVTAKGNISGYAHVPSCAFQTIRRSEGALSDYDGRSRMLELRLTSGALVVDLNSDQQRLLHYRADPLDVEIFDSWSMPDNDDQSRPLQLSFTVTSPEVFAVATVGTIPKLLSYTNKFKADLDAQRQGASRESTTFRSTRTPKPENPLSAVAEAMLNSARSRFQEAELGLSYMIQQHMSLRLDLLRLIVFPRSMNDMETAQFVGRDVRGRLDRFMGSDLSPAQRDLHLSFSSMSISRYTHLRRPDPLDGFDGREWLSVSFKDVTEAIIVGLPSMKMHMVSEEEKGDGPTTALIYDFYSEFVRREGMKAFEDIYITLNMSLYSWLTVLRKNLTREMDQVRLTEDWRTSVSNASSMAASGSQRRKAPEPLTLVESAQSALFSTTAGTTPSPYAPLSARYSRHEQLRSPLSAHEQSLSADTSQPPPVPFPSPKETSEKPPSISQGPPKRLAIEYKPRIRHIERLTMRQLGEATPDVMHPFFMKKAGFNLEDSLPQYVNEYATAPLEEIMEVLLKLYSRQLLAGTNQQPQEKFVP